MNNNESYDFHCMLCGSGAYRVRKGHARDDTALIPLECSECGLVTLSSHTIDDNFYAESHMHDSEPCDPALELQQSAEDTERRFAQWEHLITGKHVLDIGCGAGGFLLKAREVAASVTGIEPERRLAGHFKANELQVYSSLSDVPCDETFDVITMFHVLEHIQKPHEMLQQLRGRMQRGTLVIEVPSASDALLTLYDNASFAQFTYWSCHLYLYTPETLNMLLTQAGFRVEKMIQFQRYPLSNHLYWLAMGKPGGQHVWGNVFSSSVENAYAEDLAKQQRCDTVIGVFSC